MNAPLQGALPVDGLVLCTMPCMVTMQSVMHVVKESHLHNHMLQAFHVAFVFKLQKISQTLHRLVQ